MGRVRKFIGLPWRDKLLFVSALLRLWQARLRCLWLSPGRLEGLLRPRRPRSGGPAVVEATLLARAEWAVQAASALAPGATCLVQALALQSLLLRRGVASQVRLAVAHGSVPDLRAHAWLEAAGQALLAGEAHGYAVLPAVTRGES